MWKSDLAYRDVRFTTFCADVCVNRDLDVILATAKTLEIDLAEIFDLEKYNFDKKIEASSNNYNLALLLECSQGVIEALIKREENASPDKIFEIIQKVYKYSKKYSRQKLDTAFLA